MYLPTSIFPINSLFPYFSSNKFTFNISNNIKCLTLHGITSCKYYFVLHALSCMPIMYTQKYLCMSMCQLCVACTSTLRWLPRHVIHKCGISTISDMFCTFVHAENILYNICFRFNRQRMTNKKNENVIYAFASLKGIEREKENERKKLIK